MFDNIVDVRTLNFIQKNISSVNKSTELPKKKVIKDVLGEQISSQTLTFLMLLVDRNRISILDTIAKRFLELSDKNNLLINTNKQIWHLN